MKVDVAISGIGLQRVFDAALLAALLPNVQRTSVVSYVALDAEREKLRDAEIRASEECSPRLIFALRVGNDVRHLFAQESRTMLLPLVDLMDVHKEVISIAVMNGDGKLVMESIIETRASTILQCI